MVMKSPASFVICSFLILLTILSFPLTSASANEIGQVVVEGNLNVRTAPSTQGEIVGKLQAGDEVEIIEQTGEWLEISSKVGNGFVHSSYIKVHTANDKSNTSNQADDLNSPNTSNKAVDAKSSTTPNQAESNGSSSASSSSEKISVYVNGELLKLPIEPPVIDGRVLVPFRGIGENLGITVKWLADTRQIEAIDPNKNVLFTINESKVIVNNEALSINPAPTIVENNTVIPLRFFAESYGAKVQWDDKGRTVTIVQGSANDDREESSSSNSKPPVVGDAVRTTVQAMIEVDGGATVYEDPSTSSDHLGELAQGDSVKVYEKPKAQNLNTNVWLEVDYKGKLGYIKADSIRPLKETIKGTVTATSLNVRENADASSNIIGSLAKGQQIIIFDVSGNWARIKLNGNWGYVHTNYVSMKVNQQTYSVLGDPALEFYDNSRAYLSWSKTGTVTTSHKLLADGVEISSNATNIDEWSGSHPAISRIEYIGSKIRIYFSSGYHFVVRHSTNKVRITLLSSGLEGKRITVDAGHGDHDPGAKGPGGTKEKDVNLAVALKVAGLLRDAGAQVTLTRSNDTFLSLAERVQVAHNKDADAFVSIHSDSFNATSQGSSTFYHSAKNPSWQQSKQLSDIAIKKITSQLGTVSRGSNDKSLHVIRETEIPAILVEMAFISNPKEEAKLKSEEYQQKAAQAIFDSFVDFYN